MDNQLYSFEEVCELMENRNLVQFERDDSQRGSFWQLKENGSTLYVKTKEQKRFVLCVTESDYNSIRKKADNANLCIVLKESKKEEVAQIISQYESVASKAILFIRFGNKILNPEFTGKNPPHEIVAFTNESLEFLLDCLCANDAYVPKTPVKFVPKVKKVQEPELTDDEIKDVFPEGCEVFHPKYGEGTITQVSAGKITVLFEDDELKILSAKICINKQILERI